MIVIVGSVGGVVLNSVAKASSHQHRRNHKQMGKQQVAHAYPNENTFFFAVGSGGGVAKRSACIGLQNGLLVMQGL